MRKTAWKMYPRPGGAIWKNDLYTVRATILENGMVVLSTDNPADDVIVELGNHESLEEALDTCTLHRKQNKVKMLL
jgi:hypothetical protein